MLLEPRDSSDPMDVVVKKGKPSDSPFYQFILKELLKGEVDHAGFVSKIENSMCVLDYIEEHSDYATVAEWMKLNGYSR